MQRIAMITGASGFVGSHLCRRLVREGWMVYALMRRPSLPVFLQDIEARLTIRPYDGTLDSIQEAMGECKPDVVFHLASLYISEHTPHDVDTLIRSNVLLGTQLLEAMAVHGIKRLINTGTSWQHFENKVYSPVNLYAATKQAFEAILQYYVESRHMRVISLKLFDTYGPRDLRPKLINMLMKSSATTTPLVMSPGEQVVDLVYVDDVVEAFFVAAQMLWAQGVEGMASYAVDSGEPIRLRDLVAIFEQITGRKLAIEWGGRGYREREVMRPWDMGMRLPGWTPRYDLRRGLARLMEEG